MLRLFLFIGWVARWSKKKKKNQTVIAQANSNKIKKTQNKKKTKSTDELKKRANTLLSHRK